MLKETLTAASEPNCIVPMEMRLRKVKTTAPLRRSPTWLIAQLDDLCYSYLDFCVDHLYFISSIFHDADNREI